MLVAAIKPPSPQSQLGLGLKASVLVSIPLLLASFTAEPLPITTRFKVSSAVHAVHMDYLPVQTQDLIHPNPMILHQKTHLVKLNLHHGGLFYLFPYHDKMYF